MPVIAVAPFVLKNASMKIGADNYEAHVSQVEFAPQTSVVSWKGLTPTSVFTDTTAATWECTISYAQDWTTTNSLSSYLLANAGTQVVAVFGPIGATTGKPIFTATIMLVPPTIGGTVDNVAVASATFGVVGVPVKSVGP